METLHEALRLIKRQTELEGAMRRPGGIRVTEEEEREGLDISSHGEKAYGH